MKLKKVFETAVIVLGTIGWWGFVYPQLSLVPEEEALYSEMDEVFFSEKGVWDEYGTKENSPRIKSWIWEYVCQMRDKKEAAAKAAECEE